MAATNHAIEDKLLGDYPLPSDLLPFPDCAYTANDQHQTKFSASDRLCRSRAHDQKLKERVPEVTPQLRAFVSPPCVAPAGEPLKSSAGIDVTSLLYDQDHFVEMSSFEPLSVSTLAEHSSQSRPESQKKRDKPKGHTPRPPNSFILYRREKHMEISAQYKGGKTLNNNVVSKIVANMWRQESPEVKAQYAAKAEEEKKAHMLKYPDYKYRPRKPSAKTKVSKKTEKKPVSYDNVIEHIVLPRKGVDEPTYPSMQEYAYPHVYGRMDMDRPLLHVDSSVYTLTPAEDVSLSNPYESQHEFLYPESLMPHPYGQPWSMSPSAGVWEMGLDHQPLGSLSP